MPDPCYITTSIPYVNAKPHVGFALELVQADTLARHRRQLGQDVYALTGADENSLKNVLAAEAAGLPVAEFVALRSRDFQALSEPLNLSFDQFIRTSFDPRHAAGAQKLWTICAQRGDLYKAPYRGLYCTGCEQFYTPDELVNGCCPEHLTVPEVVEEDNWHFRLSRYAPAVRKAIASGRLTVLPETRRNEVLRFIDAGLTDFSVSRSTTRARGWGIPVPGDPSQVMYVWWDALINYLTALDYAIDGPLYERYWRGRGERLHVIGKGILRFHAVYWPAMLLSAGEPLPTTIWVHEYLTVNGQKISKSLGNTIDPLNLVSRYGTDALRYWLLREPARTEDADFTESRLVNRYNQDLANDLGNLVQRAVTLVVRYRDGAVPPLNRSEAPSPLRTIAGKLDGQVRGALAVCDFRAALAATWELVTAANRFVERSAPWQLAKAEQQTGGGDTTVLDAVLAELIEAVRLVGYHLAPFLPATSAQIATRLGLESPGCSAWGTSAFDQRLEAPKPLFPRIP